MTEFNTELFQKVRDAIESESSGVRFRMSEWEGTDARFAPGPVCATTRCVAGWAITIALNAPLYSHRDTSGDLVVSDEVKGLAASLNTYDDDFEGMGAHLLGLNTNPEVSEEHLFYTPEDVAGEFVRAAADGEDDRAREILDDYNES